MMIARYKYLHILLIFLASISCASTDLKSEVRGIYYFGHAVSAFIKCGETEAWWVDGDTETPKKLNNIYEKLIQEEYGNLYVILNGNFTKKEGNSDYIGILIPNEIFEYSTQDHDVKNCVPNINKLKI